MILSDLQLQQIMNDEDNIFDESDNDEIFSPDSDAVTYLSNDKIVVWKELPV